MKPIGFAGCFCSSLRGRRLPKLRIYKSPGATVSTPAAVFVDRLLPRWQCRRRLRHDRDLSHVGPALTAVTVTPVTATAPLVSETFNGFVGGIQAGYNWQAGVFVLGVEGDLDAAGLQGNAPCVVVLNCTMKHNWFADITGRVGVVAVDRL